ncbi:MAG: PorP/SprF family type IX secretion system membrane protein [Cytophagaceae bacterium]|jgi:type IX secretion system PorP/SprF family membrane protein|nr:PorP/SprF family type IX secretion system membrane protein [Cytophagaceae bacterium]
MKKLVVYILLFGSPLLKGQDLQFSQFESTPIQINPASVGANQSYELIFGYRSQWKQLDQKFNTPVVTGILPFISKANKSKGGLGFTALTESNGSVLAYKNSGGAISYSYAVNFKKMNLFAGISTGFYQRSLSGSFSTGTQYQSGTGYNSNEATGEEANLPSRSYVDLGSGLYMSDANNCSYLGIAAYHLTSPNIGLSNTDKLPMRFTIHGGYKFLRKSNTPITPEFVANFQNGMQRTIVGAKLDYLIKGNNGFSKDLSLGVIGRYALKDAFIFGLSLTKNYFTLAVSQDFTLSKVGTYNKNLGASEVRLSMRIPSKRKQAPEASSTYNLNQTREFIVKKEEEKDNTKSYTLHLQETVKFAFNDSSITSEGKRTIEDVAQLLIGNKYLKVKVIGHSDNLGSKKRNQEISEVRARMVAEYLISQGIDKKRVQIVAKGDSEPVKGNDTEQGRAENRRVEFLIWK